jgi:hypothetical protein
MLLLPFRSLMLTHIMCCHREDQYQEVLATNPKARALRRNDVRGLMNRIKSDFKQGYIVTGMVSGKGGSFWPGGCEQAFAACTSCRCCRCPPAVAAAVAFRLVSGLALLVLLLKGAVLSLVYQVLPSLVSRIGLPRTSCHHPYQTCTWPYSVQS